MQKTAHLGPRAGGVRDEWKARADQLRAAIAEERRRCAAVPVDRARRRDALRGRAAAARGRVQALAARRQAQVAERDEVDAQLKDLRVGVADAEREARRLAAARRKSDEALTAATRRRDAREGRLQRARDAIGSSSARIAELQVVLAKIQRETKRAAQEYAQAAALAERELAQWEDRVEDLARDNARRGGDAGDDAAAGVGGTTEAGKRRLERNLLEKALLETRLAVSKEARGCASCDESLDTIEAATSTLLIQQDAQLRRFDVTVAALLDSDTAEDVVRGRAAQVEVQQARAFLRDTMAARRRPDPDDVDAVRGASAAGPPRPLLVTPGPPSAPTTPPPPLVSPLSIDTQSGRTVVSGRHGGSPSTPYYDAETPWNAWLARRTSAAAATAAAAANAATAGSRTSSPGSPVTMPPLPPLSPGSSQSTASLLEEIDLVLTPRPGRRGRQQPSIVGATLAMEQAAAAAAAAAVAAAAAATTAAAEVEEATTVETDEEPVTPGPLMSSSFVRDDEPELLPIPATAAGLFWRHKSTTRTDMADEVEQALAHSAQKHVPREKKLAPRLAGVVDQATLSSSNAAASREPARKALVSVLSPAHKVAISAVQPPPTGKKPHKSFVPGERRAALRGIFEEVDAHRHQQVDVKDLLLALRRSAKVATFLHMPMRIRQEDPSRTTLQKIFDVIDANHDGRIAWTEFEAYFFSHSWDPESGEFRDMGAPPASVNGNDVVHSAAKHRQEPQQERTAVGSLPAVQDGAAASAGAAAEEVDREEKSPFGVLKSPFGVFERLAAEASARTSPPPRSRANNALQEALGPVAQGSAKADAETGTMDGANARVGDKVHDKAVDVVPTKDAEEEKEEAEEEEQEEHQKEDEGGKPTASASLSTIEERIAAAIADTDGFSNSDADDDGCGSENVESEDDGDEDEAEEQQLFQQALRELALEIGIDVETETHLLHIAEKALAAEPPDPWQMAVDENSGHAYYSNADTGVSQWTNPALEVFKQEVADARNR